MATVVASAIAAQALLDRSSFTLHWRTLAHMSHSTDSVRTSLLLRLLLLGGCALGPVGCDQGPDGPLDGPAGAGGKADDADVDSAAPALAEAYALRLTSDVQVRNEDDELATHTTDVVALAVVGQEGSNFEIEMIPCAIDLPAADFEPQLGPGVIDSLDPVVFRGVAATEQDGSRWLRADPAAIVAGVELDDPLADPMPDDPDDDRFVDQDGDDEPGISVRVSAFTVYAAARVIFGLSGEIGADGSIEGDANLTLDFAVLDDSIPFVDARERAEESAANSEVVSQDHRFVMVPLTRSSCTDALGAV